MFCYVVLVCGLFKRVCLFCLCDGCQYVCVLYCDVSCDVVWCIFVVLFVFVCVCVR